jgi:NAD+ diphosphatase
VSRFDALVDLPDSLAGDALCFAFAGDLLLFGPDGIPSLDEVLHVAAPVRQQVLGVLDGRLCVSAELEIDEPPAGFELIGLRALWGRVDDVVWTLAGRGLQIVAWDRDHAFCGRCATPTEGSPGERARRCPNCGLHAYPRLSPAIIVLVERDDGAALLAHGVRFPSPMYSCLAGFVEPGESLEEAVHREIREETGIEVDDIRYFGSQPWPFPNSLMIGFRARYAGGELRFDPAEIVDGRWFRRDELPPLPPSPSIARKLIDAWLRQPA